MVLIYSFLFVSFTSLALAIVFDKKVDYFIPFVFIYSGIIVSLFTYLKMGNLGIIVCVYVAPFIIISISIYKVVKERIKLSAIIKKVFTAGFFVYILFCVYAYLLGRFKGLSSYDELTIWGTRPYEMITNGSIEHSFSNDKYVHTYNNYPLFFSSIETIFCYFGNGYKEGYLYIGLITCCLSFFIPLFDNYGKKDFIRICFVFLAILLLSICTSPVDGSIHSVFGSLYVDYPMALLGSFCVYKCFLDCKKKLIDFIYVILSFIALSFSKQIGLFFVLLAIVTYVLTINKKYTIKKSLVAIVIVCSIAISYYFFSRTIAPLPLIVANTFQRNLCDYGIVFLFIKELFFGKMHFGLFQMSYFFNIIFIMIIFNIVIFFVSRSNNKYKKMCFLLIVFGFLWAFLQLLFVLYMNFIINTKGLLSYERYMGTYIYFCLVLCIYFVIYELSHKNNAMIRFYCFLLFELLFVNNIKYGDRLLTVNLTDIVPNKEFTGYGSRKDTLFFKEITRSTPNNSKILIINQFPYDYYFPEQMIDYINFNNYVEGQDYFIDFCSLGIGDCTNIYKNLTKKEYINLLSSYNYVYLYSTNKEYYDRYWKETLNDIFLDNGFYKINCDGNDIKLIFLYTIE